MIQMDTYTIYDIVYSQIAMFHPPSSMEPVAACFKESRTSQRR